MATKAWFGAKKFGYGLSPKTWQGWLSTGVFVAMVMATRWLAQTMIGDSGSPRVVTLVLVIGETLAFLVFAWRHSRDQPGTPPTP